DEFITLLKEKHLIDYFRVHSELKEAFIEGFRFGYESRTADLVLGPHVEKAAGDIGADMADEFVKVIDEFERGWPRVLKDAVNIFVTLIIEGSYADREAFIKHSMEIYREKYKKTAAINKNPTQMAYTEGGTLLHLNVHAVLTLPTEAQFKAAIYHNSFVAMGDEMGKNYRHNLIKRDAVIERLRRIKPAFKEVIEPRGNKSKSKWWYNYVELRKHFVRGYQGSDGSSVFKSMAIEAEIIGK
ncbi:MAG: hypothetical protein HQL69_21040, partial [Magnetococcales bacterium]|nr:hypothetical protein [Magnetococcales bacterium]